jgi:hypothetical protein
VNSAFSWRCIFYLILIYILSRPFLLLGIRTYNLTKVFNFQILSHIHDISPIKFILLVNQVWRCVTHLIISVFIYALNTWYRYRFICFMSNLILRYYFMVYILIVLNIRKHFKFNLILRNLILDLSLFIIYLIFYNYILVVFDIFIVNDIVLNWMIWWLILIGLHSLWLGLRIYVLIWLFRIY